MRSKSIISRIAMSQNQLETIRSSGVSLEQAKTLIGSGLLKPLEILDYIRSANSINEFISKEFLDYLLEKGLNLDDIVSIENSRGVEIIQKAFQIIIQFFPSEVITSLFKNGLIKVSEETVTALFMAYPIKQDVILELLKDGLLPANFEAFHEPLLMKLNIPEVRNYLINNGEFEKLSTGQKIEFIINTIVLGTHEDEKVVSLLNFIKERHGYSLSEVELISTLASGSKKLIQYAIDNGLNIKDIGSLYYSFMNSPNIEESHSLTSILFRNTSLEIVKFLSEKGADLTAKTEEGFSFSTVILLLKNRLTKDYKDFSAIIKYLYANKVAPHPLDFAILSQYNEAWQEFEKYFTQVNLNETFVTSNLFFIRDVAIQEFNYLTKYSLIHFAIAINDENLIQYLIGKNIDLNVIDSSGKTPIFYASTKEQIDLFVANGASIDVVDNDGNTLLHTTTDINLLKIFSDLGANQNHVNNKGQKWYTNKSIKQLIENDLLPNWQDIPKLVNLALQTGNIIEANFLYQNGSNFVFDLHRDLIESIKLGVFASKEANKFQALIAILTKNEIQLPSFLYKYWNDPKDYENTNELKMVLSDQFLNALVDKYLAQFEVKEGNQCLTEYSKYAVSMSQVVKQIEEDVALEVLILNNIPIVPLQKEYFVYRGLELEDVEGFTNHNLLHGHKALLKGGVHNFGFHTEQPWSKTMGDDSKSWEFAGNYVSFSKAMAKSFAGTGDGWLTSWVKDGSGVLIQIKVGQETKFACGDNMHQYELVTLSTIPVQAIKSITVVKTGQVISNPNYVESTLDHEDPLTEDQMKANYEAMGCTNFVTLKRDSISAGSEYSSYEKFIETFTPAELAEHRKKVYLTAEPEMCFVE